MQMDVGSVCSCHRRGQSHGPHHDRLEATGFVMYQVLRVTLLLLLSSMCLGWDAHPLGPAPDSGAGVLPYNGCAEETARSAAGRVRWLCLGSVGVRQPRVEEPPGLGKPCALVPTERTKETALEYHATFVLASPFPASPETGTERYLLSSTFCALCDRCLMTPSLQCCVEVTVICLGLLQWKHCWYV